MRHRLGVDVGEPGRGGRPAEVDVRDILAELGRRRMVGGQEDMIIDVALDLLEERAGEREPDSPPRAVRARSSV